MTLLTTIAVVALTVAAVALCARHIPSVSRPILAAAALAPYLMLGAPVAVIAFAVLRNWPLVTLASALTIASAVVQLPWYVGTKADGVATVRVVSANLRLGSADARALVQLAKQHADILAVQELTPELADRISAAGIDDAFPYRALSQQEGPVGVGIWSRYPIQRGRDYDDFWLGLLTAGIRIPDVATEATVIAVHISAPGPHPLKDWRNDMARLGRTLQEIGASSEGPVVLAGDLNATPDVLEFRRLLRDGYRDAAEQAGAGLTRTYPANMVLPPVLALDHILTRGATATDVRTLPIPGSDHRALIADIVAPR
jgi:endonuclease/exonuclease/phosphatase (EEP) superfamily protein YafD